MNRDHLKDVGDVLAGLFAIGSLAELLPLAASILAILWTGIRIYEWARVRLFGLPPTKVLD